MERSGLEPVSTWEAGTAEAQPAHSAGPCFVVCKSSREARAPAAWPGPLAALRSDDSLGSQLRTEPQSGALAMWGPERRRCLGGDQCILRHPGPQAGGKQGEARSRCGAATGGGQGPSVTMGALPVLRRP